MNLLTKILTCLLIITCITSEAQSEKAEPELDQDIGAMVERLETDTVELEFLSEKVKTIEKMDRDVLVFRMDARGFRVLNDFEVLVNRIAGLEEVSSESEELKKRLIEASAGIGNAILERINEIKQRIDESYGELESLSGSARVASLAYLQSLEAIRINYYQALERHIQGRTALGLSSEELRARFDPRLSLYAETLAGRVELTDASLSQVRTRAQQIPDDADIQAALKKLKAQHSANLKRLETIIPILDSLDLPSATFKTTLIQHSGSAISVSLFSSSALSIVLKDAWAGLKDSIKAKAPDMALRLLVFLAVIFLFRIFSRVTRRVVRAATDRSSLDLSDLLKNMLVSISGGTVMAVGILMALSQVGISLAPMLAGLGVAGFIIGFALQDSLGNFAAGAMILIYRPYDVNDFVETAGASGLVKKMNLVSTTITTFDNQTLVVPNSKIWGDVIKNVTAQHLRRVDLEFGIGYDDDIELAEKVLSEIVEAHEKVLKKPQPNIRLHTLGDSSVNFIVPPWVKTDDYWDVYWDIMREVKLRFDREGISIPFPQRDVHLYTEKENQAI